MNRIEKNIISSVFDRSSYLEVSFLEPEDFTTERGKYFWSLIQEKKGDIVNVVLELESKDRDDLINEMMVMGTVHELNNLKMMALLMVEMRFQRLLKLCLYNLSLKSEKASERDLLNESFQAVDEHDFFHIMDNLLDYISHHASTYTISRINDFKNYVNQRVQKVKQTIE